MDRHYPAGAAHCLHVDSFGHTWYCSIELACLGIVPTRKLPNNLQSMLINMDNMWMVIMNQEQNIASMLQKWQQNGLTNVLDTHGIIHWKTCLGFVQVREVDKYLTETYCFPVAGMTGEWVEQCFVRTWLCLLASRYRVRFSSESCQISCRLC